jgi:ubiquinone biosynthesis protein
MAGFSWVETGLNLGQAVRNVQRLRQIIGVFAKHGYADVIRRLNLGRFLPTRLQGTRNADDAEQAPVRLRKAFEELGPTFVKLGQVLSTRSDLLPQEYLDELTRLQDTVQPIPYEEIKKVLEEELGRDVQNLFAEVMSTPLASASIAQVHEARLKNGQKVILKVQRPGLRKVVETDIALLAFIAKAMERYLPESRIFQPTVIVDEFFNTLSYELDFVIEANNAETIAENLRDFETIVVPKIFHDYSTGRVLCQEKFEGIRLNNVEALDRAQIDKKRVVHEGAKAFFKTVLIDGVFHGDLHGGNLFVLPNSKVGIIDFGMVGRLSRRARRQFGNMVVALLDQDYETLCYLYAELGATDSSIDMDGFQREVKNTLAPYMGLSISKMNIGRILTDSTRIATKYKIKVPGDWMLVFKAILTTEGMGRTLDPDFDMLEIGEEMIGVLLQDQFSPANISKDVLWFIRDTASLMQALPRQLKFMLRQFNDNNFAVEIRTPELEALREQMRSDSKKGAQSVLAAGFIIAAAMSLQYDASPTVGGVPAIPAVLFLLGLLVAARTR